MANEALGKVGVLWRGDRAGRAGATPENNRLRAVFNALVDCGIEAEPVVFGDDMVDETREQLRQLDGVLVWVDPIMGDVDRSRLDALLREIASGGVWVSTHPDVILKMGTKEVLVTTREVGWGGDTHLYGSMRQFEREFPPHLASSGTRVLKQNRGNAGIGVWKVELLSPARNGAVSPDTIVRVQHAHPRDRVTEELRLGDFIARCAGYLAADGQIIDQPFQSRIADGMIRCYMVRDEVVGFAHQWPDVTPDAPPEPSPSHVFGLPAGKTMYSTTEPRFTTLKARLESAWIPGMQCVLDIGPDTLPLLWDADFLYGPKTRASEDTYVLCEINVSSVFPFPDQVPAKLAQAVAERVSSPRN